MSAAVHHLFAVRETDPSPFAIPAPPGRTATYAVSMSGMVAEDRIEASRSRILTDPQTRNYDAGGIRRRHHALANLPLETASEFRDLPSQAIAVAAEARLLPIGLAGCGAAHDVYRPIEHVSATASPRLPFWYRHRMPKMKSKSPTIRSGTSLRSKPSWRVPFLLIDVPAGFTESSATLPCIWSFVTVAAVCRGGRRYDIL